MQLYANFETGKFTFTSFLLKDGCISKVAIWYRLSFAQPGDNQ